TYVGLLTAGLSFVYGAWIIYQTIAFGNPVPGYPSLIVVVLFLGGLQIFFIGVIGEYVGRIYDETKQRPLYVVQNYRPPKTGVLKAVPSPEIKQPHKFS
ncbi:MAG: hypothetical protein RL020_314, partial [Pseudomonadota bacterium]